MGWLGIDSSHLVSHCGSEPGNGNLVNALDGLYSWNHNTNHTHEFILDLGQNYNTTKFKAIANSNRDPTNVDIYVSETNGDWGVAVATGVSVWQDTNIYVEVDSTNKVGRYIRVVINNTEDVFTHKILWGKASMQPIFDVFVDPTPQPDPMTFSSLPAGVSKNSVTMTASLATVPPGDDVEYSFVCVSGGGNNSGWQDERIYVDTGLTPGTTYCYTVKARNKTTADTTSASASACGTTFATVPTPNPMTFLLQPTYVDHQSIIMEASEATCGSGDSVEYLFEDTESGGNNSGWQSSRTWTDTGLEGDTEYCYTVTARNATTLEETTASSAECDVTYPETPEVPSDLVATPSEIYNSRISLSWIDNSSSYQNPSFEVYRSTNGTDFSLLVKVASGTTSYTDTTCEAETKYWYKIRTYVVSVVFTPTATAYSGYSDTVYATTIITSLIDPDWVLKNEVLSGTIDKIEIVERSDKKVVIEFAVPASTIQAGIKELGLYTADGTLMLGATFPSINLGGEIQMKCRVEIILD